MHQNDQSWPIRGYDIQFLDILCCCNDSDHPLEVFCGGLLQCTCERFQSERKLLEVKSLFSFIVTMLSLMSLRYCVRTSEYAHNLYFSTFQGQDLDTCYPPISALLPARQTRGCFVRHGGIKRDSTLLLRPEGPREVRHCCMGSTAGYGMQVLFSQQ